MSSRQMEEQYEQDFNEALADELGITPEELEDILESCDPHESSDGFQLGYNVNFLKDADPNILSKIPRAVEQGWVRIGAVL